MRVTLFMSMSLNGITSRPDYREDFLSADNWGSFLECARQTGALIWGRKTQEKVQQWNSRYFEQMRDIVRVVVSTDPDFELLQGFELATSPRDALDRLKARGLTRATLGGGSILNSSFAREHLIDELVLNVEAVVIGRGIPLFAPQEFDMPLEMEGMRHVGERIIQLRYRVLR